MNKKNALKIVKKDGYELKNLPAHFKKDKDIVLTAVKQKGNAIIYADESLRKDKKISLAAVKQNGSAIMNIDESLKKDEKFIKAIDWDVVNNTLAEATGMNAINKKGALELVQEDGLVLKYLHHLKKDKKVVLEAVKQVGHALEFADKVLKKDRNFILKAVKQNGYAVFYGDKNFKKDKKIVLEALKQDVDVFEFIDDSLKKDEKFVLNVLKQGSYILPFCDDNCNKNKKIILEAQKILNNKITLLTKKKNGSSINDTEKKYLEFNKKEMTRLEYFLSEINKKKK